MEGDNVVVRVRNLMSGERKGNSKAKVTLCSPGRGGVD